MKPLISYYGGKQKMVKNLLPLIPPHKIYCEPFCGGASLFFAKDKPIVTNDGDYIEVLNDTNKDLTTLYRICKSIKKEFLEKLDEIPYSEYCYSYFKEKENYDCDIEKAVSFYVRIMMSFANKLNNGFAFGKKTHNHACVYFNHLERLPEIIDRLKGVYIFDRDALDLISLFDCPKSFFYCDPPYPNTEQGQYKGYTQQDFEKLITILKNCQGSFMLSCYDNPAVPHDWERHEFSSINSSSNTAKGGHRQKRTEVVWRKLSPWAKEQQQQKQYTFDEILRK